LPQNADRLNLIHESAAWTIHYVRKNRNILLNPLYHLADFVLKIEIEIETREAKAVYPSD